MKRQKIKQIKFRSQYLYLVSELIDNALFFKKQYSNICLIETGFFSNKVKKLIQKTFPDSNIEFLNVNKLSGLKAKNYDLVLAPIAIQFMKKLNYDIASIYTSLKPDGLLLANGFNVLSSTPSILDFKEEMQKLSLKPSMVSIFDLGDLVNKHSFKDKAIDRENFLIEGSKIELINLYCCKKGLENDTENIKVVIN